MIAYLFYLLVALFPFGILLRFALLPTVVVSASDAVCVAILLFSLPLVLHTLKKKPSYIVVYGVFLTISLLGLTTHSKNLFEFLASVSYLVRLSIYGLLIIPLISLQKQTLYKLKLEACISGALFIALGYVQYVYYPSLRNLFYLGWDEHLYRLFSTLLDPNFAGIYIVLVLLLCVTTFVSFSDRFSLPSKILGIMGIVVLVPALFLTYSRSSYIAALVASIVFLVLIKQKKILVVLLAVFVLGLFMLPKGMGGEGVKLLRTASVFARLETYNNALQIFYHNPIVGVGFNSLRFTSRDYGFISAKDALVSHSAAGVPNSYLVLLATTGITGAVTFIVFLALFFKDVGRVYRNKKYSLYSACVMSSCAAVLTHSLFENTLFYAPVLLWLVMVTGILFGEAKKS